MPKVDPRRVLITSSRMPYAIDELAKLGEAGHRAFAADTFAYALGPHAAHVVEGLVTPSPRERPVAYVEAIERFVEEHAIDQVVPCFEEVFYLARRGDRLRRLTELFAPDFATLAMLHDRSSFLSLARELGLPVPAPSDHPSVLEGEELCAFGVARHGRLTAHATYVHPMTFEGTGGIAFESVDAPDVVDATRRVVEATGYHGQISLDFRRTPRGLVAIECNPRPTAGVALMSTEMFIDAMYGAPGREPRVVPAGERRTLAPAVIRDMLPDWHMLPTGLEALGDGGDDIYASLDDLGPALYQLVGYFQAAEPVHERAANLGSYLHDICWDGSPMP